MRLERDGPNELPRAGQRTMLHIIADVLREPMLAMLLAAGVAYLMLGDRSEAIILMLFAGFSIAVTVVQESRTENVLEALRDLSAPRALVIRDGKAVRIPGREVVTGDLLVMEQGDRVAADAILVEARNFQADESLLTGESVPVRKRAGLEGDPDTSEPGGDDHPHIYSGTLVSQGSGVARVVATGTASRIGAIGRSLAALETEAPRLQGETGRIVRICAIGGGAIALLVVVLYGMTRGNWLEAVLAGIAIGMSLLPEEFPVVLTIFLAMGAWRIAQAGVLTRRAAAIESMGAATILCTDKTGTLTQNRMAVSQLWLPGGDVLRMTGQPVDGRFAALVEMGALASAPVPVDPMEVAFHDAARLAQTAGEGRDGWEIVHSYGLSSELLAMSNIWRVPQGDGAPGFLVASKGAPEAIAQLCALNDAQRLALEAAAKEMASRGMRVLGVASAPADADGPALAHEAHDFTLMGLVGLADPLRPGVPEAVALCRSAGIRVAMITGDYAATACAIAAEAGIDTRHVMTGSDVAGLSDLELMERVPDVTIFARSMPEQKLRIVAALKAAGEVVAMTGDGVNDAPALKSAHIGVAMGKRGTDVAREAADIVLVDDDFGAIVAAIRLGRRIYDNIRKAMGFIFGVHVPIAGLAILPLVTGMPIIFGPIQIALLEMIIDPVCALVFEAERDEHALMSRPPRRPSERLFSMPMVVRAVGQGGMAFIVLAGLYLYGVHMGMETASLRAFMFFALVAAIMALVLANRSFSTSLSHALVRGNRVFRYILAFIAAACATIMLVAPLRRMVQFGPLTLAQYATIAATGVLLLILFEATKRGSAVARAADAR